MSLLRNLSLDKIGLFQEKITLPPRRRMAGWKCSLEGGLWPLKSVREGGVGVPGNPGRCGGGGQIVLPSIGGWCVDFF